MTTQYFPSLSESGWVTDSLQKADYLFSQFFIANYSQTTLYPGKVTSLPYLIQENSGDPIRTASKIEEALLDYFGVYFNNVQCSVDYPQNQSSSAVYINIALAFEDNEGIMQSLTKVYDISNSKVLEVTNIINTGSTSTTINSV